jgi:hypothetical protein
MASDDSKTGRKLSLALSEVEGMSQPQLVMANERVR